MNDVQFDFLKSLVKDVADVSSEPAAARKPRRTRTESNANASSSASASGGGDLGDDAIQLVTDETAATAPKKRGRPSKKDKIAEPVDAAVGIEEPVLSSPIKRLKSESAVHLAPIAFPASQMMSSQIDQQHQHQHQHQHHPHAQSIFSPMPQQSSIPIFDFSSPTIPLAAGLVATPFGQMPPGHAALHSPQRTSSAASTSSSSSPSPLPAPASFAVPQPMMSHTSSSSESLAPVVLPATPGASIGVRTIAKDNDDYD